MPQIGIRINVRVKVKVRVKARLMEKVRVKGRVRVRVKFKVAKYLSYDIMSRSQYTYLFSLFRKITLAMTLKTPPSRI